MVEQRSPKPLVACSNRVSPAKQKSRGYMASGLLFFYEMEEMLNVSYKLFNFLSKSSRMISISAVFFNALTQAPNIACLA